MAVFLYERCTLAKRPHFNARWLNIVSNDHVKNEIQGLHVCPYFTKKTSALSLSWRNVAQSPLLQGLPESVFSVFFSSVLIFVVILGIVSR